MKASNKLGNQLEFDNLQVLEHTIKQSACQHFIYLVNLYNCPSHVCVSQWHTKLKTQYKIIKNNHKNHLKTLKHFLKNY